MSATVFVVSNYTDQITERKRKAVEGEIRRQKESGWAMREIVFFDTRDEACRYICQRAFDALKTEEKKMKAAQDRLKKCYRKFAPAALDAKAQKEAEETCSDCPPAGYPTDKTRCDECPRRAQGEADRG